MAGGQLFNQKITTPADINRVLGVLLDKIEYEMQQYSLTVDDTEENQIKSNVTAKIKTMDRIIEQESFRKLLDGSEGETKQQQSLDVIKARVKKIREKIEPIMNDIKTDIQDVQIYRLGMSLDDISENKGEFKEYSKDEIAARIVLLERVERYRVANPSYTPTNTANVALDEVIAIKRLFSDTIAKEEKLGKEFTTPDFTRQELANGRTLISLDESDDINTVRAVLRNAAKKLELLKGTELGRKTIGSTKIESLYSYLTTSQNPGINPPIDTMTDNELLDMVKELCKPETGLRTIEDAVAKAKVVIAEDAKRELKEKPLIKGNVLSDSEVQKLLIALSTNEKRKGFLSGENAKEFTAIARALYNNRNADTTEKQKLQDRKKGLDAAEDTRVNKSKINFNDSSIEDNISIAGLDFSTLDWDNLSETEKAKAIGQAKAAIRADRGTLTAVRNIVKNQMGKEEPKDAKDYSIFRFIRRIIARRQHKKWESELDQEVSRFIERRVCHTARERYATAQIGDKASKFDERLRVHDIKGIVGRALETDPAKRKTDKDIHKDARDDAEAGR